MSRSVRRLGRSIWRRLAILLLLASALTALSAGGLAAGVFQGFHHQAADGLFPRGSTDRRVVVVGVDADSLRQIPQDWPWSRDVHAELVNRLFDAGAEVVAFDVQFDSPDDRDPALVAAMRRGKVVLSGSAELDPPRRPKGPRAIRPQSLTRPNDALLEAAAGWGLANVLPDPDDGVVRALPLIAETEQEDIPSFSLTTFMALEGLSGPVTQRPFGVQVGDRVVPTESQQTLRVNFSADLRPTGLEAGGTGPRIISAGRALTGGLRAGELAGKVALIGATAPVLGDYRQTPVGKENLGLPGVLIHANALNTMLTEGYLTEASRSEVLGWVFGLALAIAVLTAFAPLKVSVPVSLLLGVGYFLFATARFEAGVVLDVVYPLLTAAAALFLGLGFQYLTEGRQRRRVAALFSEYVPAEVAARLIDEDRVDAALEGERVEISVLFCDLRGFTAQSASMEPTQVKEMLEAYYLHLGQLILEHGGTLMQYVGDEIFAVFGAPVPDPDHAGKALACALAMQDARPEVGRLLAEKNLPPILYGIGLNCGSVVAAHVGSAIRRQYAVIGDTVNIGSRLCSQAREDQICFPESFRLRVGEHPPLEDLGPIEFKNATRPIQVWRYHAHASETAGVAKA